MFFYSPFMLAGVFRLLFACKVYNNVADLRLSKQHFHNK